MSDRSEELLGQYLDGDIGEREAEELLALVQKSPALFHRLRQLIQLDEGLRQISIRDPGGELLSRAVLERLKSSDHDTDFARRVVRQLPVRPARNPRRIQGSARSAGWGWIAGSAAAVLIFVLAMVLASRPEARRPVAIRRDPSEIPIPKEPTPVPGPEKVLPPTPVPDLPIPEPAPREVQPHAPPSVVRERETPPPIPGPKKSEAEPTIVQAALPAVRFEEVDGEVFAVAGTTTIPARPGAPLPAGAGVDARGSASLLFPDGTRLELRSGTRIEEVTPGSSEEAKRIVLRSGSVMGAVAPQPANRPLTIQTPHGRVEVLGTFLKVGVESATTRVEVWDGRVRVAKSDGTSALVRSGQGAFLTPSAPIAVQPLAPPKAGALFASLWLPENRDPRWRATVDGRAKAVLFSSAAAEVETGVSVWASGTWNLVLGNLQGGMEIVPDSKTADEEGKRHEVLLRIIEGRDARPDQGIEIALTPSGILEARVSGIERLLGSGSVKDILKVRHSLPVEFEVTQSVLRLTAGGRTIFSGPHLLGGFGIVRVSLVCLVHEAGGASVDKILSPRLLYVPSAGK